MPNSREGDPSSLKMGVRSIIGKHKRMTHLGDIFAMGLDEDLQQNELIANTRESGPGSFFEFWFRYPEGFESVYKKDNRDQIPSYCRLSIKSKILKITCSSSYHLKPDS